MSGAAHAMSTPYTLQQAITTNDRFSLVGSKGSEGLSLSSGFFSNTSSSTDASHSYSFDKSGSFDHDQRVYALLIDGRYDFNYDFGSALPIHPYVNGGLGMAVFGQGAGGDASNLQSGTVPLFRMGGGVTYRMGKEWDLSLDYRAGFTGLASDQIITGRNGGQAVDLHTLNMGMHYRF